MEIVKTVAQQPHSNPEKNALMLDNDRPPCLFNPHQRNHHFITQASPRDQRLAENALLKHTDKSPLT